MTQIESLTLGVTLGSVIDRQSRDESITDDCARTRRANAACADNPNSASLLENHPHRPSHSTDRYSAFDLAGNGRTRRCESEDELRRRPDEGGGEL